MISDGWDSKMKQKKVCKSCSLEKTLDEYHKDRCAKDGTINICKACRKNDYNKIAPYDKSILGRVKRMRCTKKDNIRARHGAYVSEILLQDRESPEDVMRELNGY